MLLFFFFSFQILRFIILFISFKIFSSFLYDGSSDAFVMLINEKVEIELDQKLVFFLNR